ncbi:MAG: hypothetical protein LBM60_09300 [Clostridium sp.]|jgi:hypothetical protein|nr:hypothetical protein [Clostridium sp.]
MRKTKKAALIVLSILLIWFALNLTGFKIGDFTLVVSAFIDEPIDVAFFAVFCVFTFLFIRFEKVGQWLLLLFLVGWAFMQSSMYFRSAKGIKSYNDFFLNEGTHRLFTMSDTILIKDTYHIILDVLILAALAAIAVSIVNIRKCRKY